MAYRFLIAANADDFTLMPSTSTNLVTWSLAPLEFIDFNALGGHTLELRFRVTDASAPRRYFRFGTSTQQIIGTTTKNVQP